MPVGYNLKKPNDGELGNKHYRRFYPKELESIVTANGDKLVVSPFLTETITKCQQKKKKSGFLGKLFGAKSGDPEEDSEQLEVVTAGKFKGILQVFNREEYELEKQKL